MQYAIDIWTEHGLLDFELSPVDLIIHGLWQSVPEGQGARRAPNAS